MSALSSSSHARRRRSISMSSDTIPAEARAHTCRAVSTAHTSSFCLPIRTSADAHILTLRLELQEATCISQAVSMCKPQPKDMNTCAWMGHQHAEMAPVAQAHALLCQPLPPRAGRCTTLCWASYVYVPAHKTTITCASHFCNDALSLRLSLERFHSRWHQ
jgi:hypothetical protein